MRYYRTKILPLPYQIKIEYEDHVSSTRASIHRVIDISVIDFRFANAKIRLPQAQHFLNKFLG